jgi:hypothetical protein
MVLLLLFLSTHFAITYVLLHLYYPEENPEPRDLAGLNANLLLIIFCFISFTYIHGWWGLLIFFFNYQISLVVIKYYGNQIQWYKKYPLIGTFVILIGQLFIYLT